MSYWTSTGKNTRINDSYGLVHNGSSNAGNNNNTSGEFYELEQGIVLDIVLDDTHPIFKKNSDVNSKTLIDVERWPADLEGNPPLMYDFDYTWIGRALIRPIKSDAFSEKDRLIWAYPLDSTSYPLLNETVILTVQDGKVYYTRALNYHNWTNNNLDFAIEDLISGNKNTVLYSNDLVTGSVESVTNYKGSNGFKGYPGQYFVANNNIRTVKRYEGDLLLESRHGQTIHFTAYDDNRKNDVGIYPDYKNGGNPMILIRNRQRPLVKKGKTVIPSVKKLPVITGTSQEKNVGGYLDENINHDGSSIHITSGQTISDYVTSCYKKIYGDGEEVSKFQGSTSFKTPILSGDQIVINTDRLILSSRYGETLHYSKKRYGIVTDNEYTVDAHQKIVLTTNTKTVINSPAIYLGEEDMTNEPALLGQTTVNALYLMCNWMIDHTHWYSHSHVDAGQESPSQTQASVQLQQLILIRDNLKSLLSRRVFITGGGLAPGQNGGSITDGMDSTKISIGSGAGVPGGFNASNYRPSV